MRVMFMLWECHGRDDMMAAFLEKGYTVDKFWIDRKQNTNRNIVLEEKIKSAIEGKNYDYVFSFNYMAVLARACHRCNTKYVSWVYDSPLVSLYNQTVFYPTNYIFLFDKAVYFDLVRIGVPTVYYLPLASAVKRFDTYPGDDELEKVYEAPISFVGSTYAENRYLFYKDLCGLDDFTKGYVDGMIQAQKRIYGSFIMEDMMTPEALKRIQETIPRQMQPDEFARWEWYYAHYFLAKYVTALERQEILNMLSEKYKVVLYTHKKTPSLPKVDNRGTVGFRKEASYVYRYSKINLNITLRSIMSGIPLRAFDVMGSGGFLLTNYQEDFHDFFVPGEDYVYYDSYEDLMEKVEYYLSHEKERAEVARNGYEKIKRDHTYETRLDVIADIVLNK